MGLIAFQEQWTATQLADCMSGEILGQLLGLTWPEQEAAFIDAYYHLGKSHRDQVSPADVAGLLRKML